MTPNQGDILSTTCTRGSSEEPSETTSVSLSKQGDQTASASTLLHDTEVSAKERFSSSGRQSLSLQSVVAPVKPKVESQVVVASSLAHGTVVVVITMWLRPRQVSVQQYQSQGRVPVRIRRAHPHTQVPSRQGVCSSLSDR